MKMTGKIPPRVKPVLSREAVQFVRKRRMASQQSIDTNCCSREEVREDGDQEEEVLLEVKLIGDVIDRYFGSLVKRKEKGQVGLLRQKQGDIQRLSNDIAEIEEEIQRLKQIYKRPKQFTPALRYSQQHLQPATLVGELTKQRQHLQLHITQHSKLKGRASDLHRQIKEVLPEYVEVMEKKKMKPISYGQFREKALVEKREKENKQRRRIMSGRLSVRSRSNSRANSVRSIATGVSEASIKEENRNMYYMQRKKSIAVKAKESARRKYEHDINELGDQYLFLKEEDGDLNVKIDQLTKELAVLQANLEWQISSIPSRKLSVRK